MIGPQDITRWADSLYGDFLRSLITGESFFPLRRERLGRVDASLDAASFHEAVKPLWDASKNQTGRGYTVVLERRSRRNRGEQNEPVAVLIESREDFHAIVGRRGESQSFERDMAKILAAFPQAREVLINSPTLVVEHAGQWDGILEVVGYLRDHPRPRCFVRALPVSVHTKFIESHAGAVEALCSAIPETGFMAEGDGFEARCGFRRAIPQIAGRFLCLELQRRCGLPVSDVSLATDAWASLAFPDGSVVVVCENKANFLSLPPLPNTLALWGQGGAASGLLGAIPWLRRSQLIYWGDLDPYGFAILAQFRRVFPHTQSIMMGAGMLERYSSHLLDAKSPPGGVALDFLTADEQSALARILRPPKGVEQEKMLFAEALDELANVIKDNEQSH